MEVLKFLNHASYVIENEDSILIHDPWFEGNAFNNGWSLLSKEITNQQVVDYLSQSNKLIYIWISHEHSDHFSISFIKSLKKAGIDCKFFFQKTADKRVLNFLKLNEFKIQECTDGKEYKIDKNLYLSVYSHSGGDSFCFLRTNTKNILNINDCVIKDAKSAQKVLSRLPRNLSIDILFTQFGYANWIGRIEDKELRAKSAMEKISRISIQDKVFKPEIIIPFASFIYFCKEENFYLNDKQNFPSHLRQSTKLNKIQNKINFMKPNQKVPLDESFLEKLQLLTHEAESYWNSFINKINDSSETNKEKTGESITETELAKLASDYLSKVRKHTLGLINFFEYFRIMNLKPISFHVYDLDMNLSLSYLKGVKNSASEGILSIHSSELAFILKNEFGWNTLFVSGAFKAYQNQLNSAHSFFRWQDAIKNGFSFKHPLHSLRVVTQFIARKFFAY